MVPKIYGYNKRSILKYFNFIKIYKLIKFNTTDDNDFRIKYLREKGMKIGKDCLINAIKFVSEPFLVEVGDEVAIAPGTTFVTHDGSTWLYKDKSKDIRAYGKIIIGNNCFISINCIILPNTKIGNNCIIGAGAVVRGIIPDNSVAFGNPATVVMRTPMAKSFIMNKKFLLDVGEYKDKERRIQIEKLFEQK